MNIFPPQKWLFLAVLLGFIAFILPWFDITIELIPNFVSNTLPSNQETTIEHQNIQILEILHTDFCPIHQEKWSTRNSQFFYTGIQILGTAIFCLLFILWAIALRYVLNFSWGVFFITIFVTFLVLVTILAGISPPKTCNFTNFPRKVIIQAVSVSVIPILLETTSLAFTLIAFKTTFNQKHQVSLIK